MKDLFQDNPFRSALSLEPLVRYWRECLCKENQAWCGLFGAVEKELAAAPELLEPIEDLSILIPHENLLKTLLSVVFPPAFWETHAVAALVPMTMTPFFASPPIQRILSAHEGAARTRLRLSKETLSHKFLMKAYLLILDKYYGIGSSFDYPIVIIAQDPDTGLDRYFRIKPHFRFVEVKTRREPRQFTSEEITKILENLTDTDFLRQMISPEDFEFQGFASVHALDVTESEVLTELERDITGKEAIFSNAGFMLLQKRLQTLFGRPEIVAGLAALQGDRVMLLNSGCEMCCNCIFSDSRHVPVQEMRGSLFHRAAEAGRIMVIQDLMKEPVRTRIEEDLLAAGKRSLLVVPLFHQGQLIGTLDLSSPLPGGLGPMDELLAAQIQPVFSMALKRSLNELDSQIDGIIKERCTAVHPAVEWRFRGAVLEHLERSLRGESSQLEPIVFRDVFPLYGATDIRGSSEGRNKAIQADLCEHLELATGVMRAAWEAKSLPFLEELAYRTGNLLDRIRNGLSSGDELTVIQFIQKELEPLLCTLRKFGPGVQQAVQAYEAAVDPNVGTVYRKRKDFEESVSVFNQRIAAYLEREQVHAQSAFPHYFEKHQTDGLEYLIYVGSSMAKNGDFNLLYVKSLRLWQILLACGIAWNAEQLKTTLRVPLETTNLILAHHSSLAVRFRFDEKRFDVDGAYDVGHEIVRSRLDKAVVRDRGERLTQPGRIAIVYSRAEESQEMVRHIHFLQSRDYLLDDLEAIELEDLPGVQGLRGLRVSVNVKSPALAARAGGIAVH